MNLYIIRHAWAGQYGDPNWPDDAQRPLTKKGRKRFAAMAAVLSGRGLAPSLIATSPMVRCHQTAQTLAEALGNSPQVIDRDELLPHGDLESLIKWTAEQSGEHSEIAWVGHAPDVGQLAAALIGQAGASIRFAKGAVAALRFNGPVEIAAAELRWLATARVLDC